MTESIKVLITCSGLGSRLGEITKFTNKSLVRIGDKAAISHIIDSYPKTTEFVITLGYFGSHVKQYLEIAHSQNKITFVEVDRYKGDGSSLAYSLLCAKEAIGESPFIFNACDTISLGSDNFDESTNTVWVSTKKKDSSHYRTVRRQGKRAISLLEKGETVSDDPIYIGKCYIKDVNNFWKSIQENIESNPQDASLSDCHAICGMIRDGIDFQVMHDEIWYDVGNLDELKRTRQNFDTDVNVLEKYDESIYFVNETVIKFFANSEINQQRILRTRSLAETVPRLRKCTQNFMSYDFTDGEILCRVLNLTPQVMTNLLEFARQNLWNAHSNYSKQKIRDMCYDFYVTKTEKRAKEYLSARGVEDCKTLINGHKVDTLENLLHLAIEEKILDGKMSNFHGDFILENIVVKSNKFTLIDWRQNFANDIEFGDVYYDLAKLNHNLHFNHDIIRSNGYAVKFVDKNCVYVDLHCSHRLLSLRAALVDFCEKYGYSMKKVDILTGIIWINMSPLHDANLGDFLYNFGKLHLQRVLER